MTTANKDYHNSVILYSCLNLGASAGDRLIVIRLDGSAIDKAERAERTRSRASETALSGNPTMANDGMPGASAHCTSTVRASTPSNATV